MILTPSLSQTVIGAYLLRPLPLKSDVLYKRPLGGKMGCRQNNSVGPTLEQFYSNCGSRPCSLPGLGGTGV